MRQRATLPPRSGHDACHPHGQSRTNGARHGDAARHGRWAPRMQTRRRDMRLSRDMSRQSVVSTDEGGRPQLSRAPAPASYLCMQLAVCAAMLVVGMRRRLRGERDVCEQGDVSAIQSEEEPSRSIPSGRSSVLLPHAELDYGNTLIIHQCCSRFFWCLKTYSAIAPAYAALAKDQCKSNISGQNTCSAKHERRQKVPFPPLLKTC